MDKIRNNLGVFIVPIIILLVWQGVTSLKLIDPLFLPKPLTVVLTLFTGLFEGTLFYDLLVTIYRSLSGFMISCIVGIPSGLLIGRNKRLTKLLQPSIDFFRSVPATALFPLFLVLFGVGDKAKIAIVIYACSLIVLINAAYGVMQVKKVRILSARTMGAGEWDIFKKIIIPESMPGIFAGLRIALSLSFVLIIVTEMFIGTNVGLGYFIINSQMVYKIPEMYGAIILAGLTGYLCNSLLLIIEKKVLHWVGN